MLKDLLQKNRSYRRFDHSVKLSREDLSEWVELTRFCASARNAQALKYRLVTEEAEGAKVFETLAWAGYLKDWAGPQEKERPVAYLIQLLDTRIEENCLCDDGIQAQTILLGAVEKGFGGCIIKAFKNEVLRRVLELPGYMKIMYVIALGKPVEKVVLEEIKAGNYEYWRDAEGTHYVPKRPLHELIF